MSAKTTTRLPIAGSQAVEELHVYLRTMGLTQRRWARRIAAQENEVRRLMVLEDHHRDWLRRSALCRLNSRLDCVANTDLATAAAHVAPTLSAPLLLRTCGVRPHQITAFSTYALARLSADPDRLDACAGPDVTNVIADFQSSWEVVAPTQKAMFRDAADSICSGLTAEWLASDAATTAVRATSSANKAREKAPAPARDTAKLSQRTSPSPPPATRPTPKVLTKKRVHSATPRSTPPVSRVHRKHADRRSWEEVAFENFCTEARGLFASALGCVGGRVVGDERWLPIARVEWATKTLRQKRLYYSPTL